MKPSERLRQAKALIDTPERWIKGEFQREVSGVGQRFCSVGAVIKVTPIEEYDDLRNRLDHAAADLASLWALELNDAPDTTHDLVMQMFDLAIANAEKEGQ